MVRITPFDPMWAPYGRDACWHCGVVLEPQRPICEDCVRAGVQEECEDGCEDCRLAHEQATVNLTLHEGSTWKTDRVVADNCGQVITVNKTVDGSACLLVGTGTDIGEEWAYVEDAHAVLERAGYCPHAEKAPTRHGNAERFSSVVEMTGRTIAGVEVLSRAANVSGNARWRCRVIACGHIESVTGILLRKLEREGNKYRCKQRHRCEFVGPAPECFRCGLDKGHNGSHSALIETGAPWFPEVDETKLEPVTRLLYSEQSIFQHPGTFDDPKPVQTLTFADIEAAVAKMREIPKSDDEKSVVFPWYVARLLVARSDSYDATAAELQKELAKEKVPGHCKDCVSWHLNMNQANDPWCSDNDSWDFPKDGSGFCSKFERRP
jgi:hypothetical protein